MVTVIKGTMKTQILEQFIPKYKAAGWEVVGEKPNEPKSEEVALALKGSTPAQAAASRGESPTTDPVTQAEAIVKTETKARGKKVIDTGLLKPAETKKPADAESKETTDPVTQAEMK